MTGIVTLAICYVLSHFYRAFLAVLSPVLSSELGMSPDEMSTALGAWFVTFAACQLLIGVLLDRIGPKLTCAIMFALGGAGGGLLFAAATSGTMVLIALGLGFAIYFIRNFAQILGESGQIPVLLAAWSPPTAAIALSLGILLNLEDG